MNVKTEKCSLFRDLRRMNLAFLFEVINVLQITSMGDISGQGRYDFSLQESTIPLYSLATF